MNCAIVENNIITNVVVIDGDPSVFGALPLPEEKWIGDQYDDTPTLEADADAMFVDHEYRLTLLELGVTEGV